MPFKPALAPHPRESRPEGRVRYIARWLLASIYGAAGILHLTHPAPFLTIVPEWVPGPDRIIALTGVAELLGAAGLLQTRALSLRHAAGWGLAAYALCVWPANFHHMQLDMAQPDHGLGLGYHVPRLVAQPLIIWWALWASGAIGKRKTALLS